MDSRNYKIGRQYSKIVTAGYAQPHVVQPLSDHSELALGDINQVVSAENGP